MYNYNFFNDALLRNMNMNNNMSNSMALFNVTDAYNNGNLYSNLYSQYKNYKPTILKANNEKEQLLLELSRVAFAAHELNLYLDLYPNDESMLALFNDYRQEANSLLEQYESKYGPLNVSSDNMEKSPFAWENSSWPWEDRYYV